MSREIDDSEYKDDLLIDEHNLEKEWEAQSGLYMKWAEVHANSIFERDKYKSELDLLYSELDGEIRADPEHFGIFDRITEAMVKATIIKQRRYKAKHLKYLESVKRSNIMQAAKETMHHRRKALENLTQLFLGGYYSSPNIPKEARRKAGNETENIINAKLKKVKRLKKPKRKK